MALPIEVHDNRYQLYHVCFHSDQILTTMTSNPNVVTNWINGIEYVHRRRLNRHIVGLDVEWRPNFGKYYRNSVATLHIYVGRCCLIFQLLNCRYIHDALTKFLLNPCYFFVGVGVANDADKLEQDYELHVETTVELTKLTVDAYNSGNYKNAGLKMLCRVVLDREMEKSKHITLGRWDYKWLNPDQVQYACVDAFVSFEIGKCLNASGH